MTSKTLRGCVLAALLLTLLASSAFAQTGQLRGRVLGEDGQGLRDAMVFIERVGVRGNYKVKTNKKGNYFHAGLPLGQYTVRLEVDGKQVYSINGYQIKLGEEKPLNFDLGEIKRESEAAQSGAGPTKDQLSAMSEQQRKEYERALKARQQQISKNKELNETFNAGMEAKRLQDYATSVQHFRKAVEIDADQHVIWGNMAEALSGLVTTKTGAERDQLGEEAIATYRKAIELEPDPAYHNNLGLLLIRLQRVDEGSAELEKAAQMAPDNAGTYYFNLGATMVNTGNTQGAIDAFRKATTAQPDFANAYYQLATVLVGTAQMKEDGSIIPAEGTVEAYQKYLDLDPQGPYAASAQAMVQSLSGKLETTFEQPKRRRKN
ncbi:MAG: carboxypeptidase regulatory-like domain-containing protein [Bryobacterales bacterium]|nr:carboxypeptidase regulatory-like domain-containing protein [Bryobacterales bacterium]